MPVTGPNKEYSKQLAKEAFSDVLLLLKEKYNAERPEIGEILPGWDQKSQNDWDKYEQQLVEVLTELIWTSDASRW